MFETKTITAKGTIVLTKNIYSIQYIKLVSQDVQACAESYVPSITFIDYGTICIIPKSEFKQGF